MENAFANNARVLAVIPAYNEQDSIAQLVFEFCREVPHVDYIVINDGSCDGTEQVLQKHGILHLTLPCNLGLDGAFRTGLLYAIEHHYDYLVQVDGDGQHIPAHIDTLVETAMQSKADIVIGSRFLGEKRPRSLRMLGSAFITAMLRLTCRVNITDPTSGMRLYNKRVMRVMADHPELAPEPDSIALLLRNGTTVKEVHVMMRDRQAGQSYLSIKRSVAYMVRVGVSILFVQWFMKKEY